MHSCSLFAFYNLPAVCAGERLNHFFHIIIACVQYLALGNFQLPLCAWFAGKRFNQYNHRLCVIFVT